MKQGIETMITEAEAGLGLKGTANKPYKGRAPVFAIDDDSGEKKWFFKIRKNIKNRFLKSLRIQES